MDSSYARWAARWRVPLGFLLGISYLIFSRPTLQLLLIGGTIAATGVAIRAYASGHLAKNQRLATSGPYAYTRNPLYLGSLMLAAGFAIAARSWWIVALMLLMFAVIYIPVIAGEERYLRQTFPEFDDYARHVPRMLPRLTRYGSEQSVYSSARYWKHREYEASIGCLVVLAILVLKLLLKLVW